MAYERLSGQGARLLDLESTTQPMHSGTIVVLDGGSFSDERGRFKLDEVRTRVAERLQLVPRFRKRLVKVPFDQGRVWVDDETFDLPYHVRLTALPSPGDDEQISTLLERIQAQRLDRTRPLWELWCVEGLEDDRVALVEKVHHALVDEEGGDLLGVLLDRVADPEPIEVPDWHPEPAPGDAELLFESLAERMSEPMELLRRAHEKALAPVRARRDPAPEAVAPHTRWNVAIGPQRRYEMVSLSAEGARSTAERAGLAASLDDVVLAACAGALRRYLTGCGDNVHDVTLRVAVPVGEADGSIAVPTLPLALGEEDAVARLRLVAVSRAALPDGVVALGAPDAADPWAPSLALGVAAQALLDAPGVNLGITIVHGPSDARFFLGARLRAAHPFVDLVDGQGLALAAFVHEDRIDFGLTGDRDAVCDLDDLAAALRDELDELTGSAAA